MVSTPREMQCRHLEDLADLLHHLELQEPLTLKMYPLHHAICELPKVKHQYDEYPFAPATSDSAVAEAKADASISAATAFVLLYFFTVSQFLVFTKAHNFASKTFYRSLANSRCNTTKHLSQFQNRQMQAAHMQPGMSQSQLNQGNQLRSHLGQFTGAANSAMFTAAQASSNSQMVR